MIRRWALYLLTLLSVLVFYVFYYGWISHFLFVVVLLLPWLSLLVSLPAMLGLRVRWNWQTEARCSRGNTAILRLGRRRAWLPAPRCRLSLQVTHVGSGQNVVWPLWLQEAQELPLDTTHCGVLRCQLVQGWVYDYLGLFRLPRRTPPARLLTVWPVPAAPQPTPHLDTLVFRRWQAKPGGGFSEQHELRPYRPGDPLRSVHWKLTAKTDDLVVREPQEPVKQLVLLTLDLINDPAQLDRILDQFCWLSDLLLQHEIPHELRYLEPSTGALCSLPIRCSEELNAAVEQLLHTPLAEQTPSLAGRPFPEADWRYHITGLVEEAVQ